MGGFTGNRIWNRDDDENVMRMMVQWYAKWAAFECEYARSILVSYKTNYYYSSGGRKILRLLLSHQENGSYTIGDNDSEVVAINHSLVESTLSSLRSESLSMHGGVQSWSVWIETTRYSLTRWTRTQGHCRCKTNLPRSRTVWRLRRAQKIVGERRRFPKSPFGSRIKHPELHKECLLAKEKDQTSPMFIRINNHRQEPDNKEALGNSSNEEKIRQGSQFGWMMCRCNAPVPTALALLFCNAAGVWRPSTFRIPDRTRWKNIDRNKWLDNV